MRPALTPSIDAGGDEVSAVRWQWAWLVGILLAGTLLRIWVWHGRLIDVDEGAHLMDGRLALQGLVPFVDFQPRPIGYTYLLAAFIKLVGPDYARVRLCVAFADTVVGVLVFLIARRLFDWRVGLLAAAAYLLFPYAIESSPTVHMEPFAALVACGVMYCLVCYFQAPGGGWGLLAAAGALVATAIYVRESGIAIALSAGLTVTVCTWRNPRLLLRRYAVLTAGFLLPCAVVGLRYTRLLSAWQWWHSQLNPLFVLLKHSHKVAVRTAAAHAVGAMEPRSVESVSLGPQTWAATLHMLRDSVLAYGALLVALAISIPIFVAAIRKQPDSEVRLAGVVLYPWVLSLAFAYGYWALYRSFFPDYAIELLPPLAIVFGFVVIELGRQWRLDRLPWWATLGLVGLGAMVFVVARLRAVAIPRFLYLAVVPLMLGRAWPKRGGWWQWPVAAVIGSLLLIIPLGLSVRVHRLVHVVVALGLIIGGWLAARTRQAPGRPQPSLTSYVALVLLGATLGMSLEVMGGPGGIRKGGGWTARAVQEIVETLRRRGHETDEVVSGAVIWEFQAGQQPFGRVTHPSKFEFGLPPAEAAELMEQVQRRPPAFVIFDGYTEVTYGAVLPDLARVVAQRYELVKSVYAGHFPVRVYERRGSTVAP